MIIPRPLAALGAAGAIALATPAGLAHADTVQPRAAGVFIYFTQNTANRLVDPPSHECLPIDGASGVVDNRTESTATLYSDPDCQYPVLVLGPRTFDFTSNPPIFSAKFTG